MKPIKHPYNLDMEYQVTENVETEKLEYVTVKVAEYTEEAEEEMLDVSDRSDYLEVSLKRIVPVEDSSGTPYDIADMDSQEFIDAINPLINNEHNEFVEESLAIVEQESLNSYVYIDKINIHGTFSEESLTAALSKALKAVTKGYPKEEWVAVAYQDRTIFKDDEPVDKSLAEKVFKELGFASLPQEISKLDKSDNIISIVGGRTLNTNLEYSPELEEELDKKKKMKP